MADFKMLGNIKLDLMCDVHDDCELLPLYCMDCDCPLCGDCVTCDHVGHKVRKVSEVIETQLRQLEEYLDSDNSILFLENLLSGAQRRQNQLAENRENLLRNVLNREEELIEKAKLWREKMSNRIITLADDQMKSLDKDVTIASALLNCKDKGLDMELKCDSIKLMFLNHGLKNILKDKGKNMSGINKCLENLEFRIGMTDDDLFDLFGQFIDRTEELSSDIYHCEEEEEEDDDDEEEEFYDSLDLKMSVKFKCCQNAVDQIVPLQNSKTLLLGKGTVYECDVKKGELNHRSLLLFVDKIALIPLFGDVLSLMASERDIKRIANGSLVTTYISAQNDNERYECVGPAGSTAYACVVHKKKVNYEWTKYISLLDEFGRKLMSFTWQPTSITSNYILCNRIFVFDVNTHCVNLKQVSVDIFHVKDDIVTTNKTYCGSVGTNPVASFYPKDIAIDHRGNILVAVPNDNAIHLLDKSLTFQKLLMTEEDGLHRPTSVALDGEGFLYVGCRDGQIHVVNYQYFISTNRLTRLKIEKSQH